VAALVPVAGDASADPSPSQRVLDTLNRTISRLYEKAPSCRPVLPSHRTMTVSDADASPELLSTFGVLRRPATEEELALVMPRFALPAEGLYRRYARIATSSSGRQLTIYPAQNVHLYKPRSERCVAALRRHVDDALRDEPASFKRATRRVLEQVIRDEWAGPAPAPAEGLFLFTHGRTGSGGGGGGVDLAAVRTRGMFMTVGGRHGSTVNALIPDGVAKVRLHYGTARRDPVPTAPGAAPRPAPRRYAHPVDVVAAVRDNVISIRVPRSGLDAFAAHVTWLAPDGTVMREYDAG
jgi:hypothetical protein